MPTDKDRKRLVRARMQKTGQSYTSARASLFSRNATQDDMNISKDRGPYAAPRSQWSTLAGMTDDAIVAKTGRTWAEWVDVLDAVAAYRMSHRDIAKYVSSTYEECSAWWAQTITVGYERIRGLREVGQRRDGAYEANKSRTYPVEVAVLYQMFRDARQRQRWLGAGVARVRTATPDVSIRFGWEDGTQVNVHFVSKGPQKSAVAIQHTKLSSKADIESAKSAWHARLDELKRLLS